MANPIVPWIGGKRRLAELLIPRFPDHTCYVEVFAGGAALFFLRSPAQCEVINDINGELVNLYRVVQHHLEEFVRQFKWAISSRQVFKWLQMTPTEPLTDIQRAARFYYLSQHAFGAKVQGAVVRDGNHRAGGEFVEDRGEPVGGTSALGRCPGGKRALAGLCGPLRPAAHVLLHGPAVLGDGGLRRAI
ncbi:restriction endonuclease subunit M [Pandoraea anapnoica]|uniref:Restriction endonuclease subunit M n=1 Tax=Pandoraea anapnoica TaxID=2508301 RepID=A0A5E5AW28_9BURK|nr:restriction endonuclease subunit M [Pandoraea anapnoica]